MFLLLYICRWWKQDFSIAILKNINNSYYCLQIARVTSCISYYLATILVLLKFRKEHRWKIRLVMYCIYFLQTKKTQQQQIKLCQKNTLTKPVVGLDLCPTTEAACYIVRRDQCCEVFPLIRKSTAVVQNIRYQLICLIKFYTKIASWHRMLRQ